MKTIAQILIFTLIVLGSFTWFSNNIPQMRAEAPKDEEVSLEGMTIESFAALGKKIFFGKGGCPLCHNAVGHRAPLLEIASGDDGPPIAARAEERLKDSRYKGKATNAQEYIMESMVAPSVFVVTGFGKTGTNDTVSPMPDVSSAPTNLSDVEVDAVIAYLQQAAGMAITVALPTGEVEVADDEGAEDTGPVKTMEELASKYECRMCHFIPDIGMAEDEADIGPSLAKLKDNVPAGMPLKEYIRESILKPNEYIAKGFEADMMPPDYAERLRVAELDMAVDYLAEKAEAGE